MNRTLFLMTACLMAFSAFAACWLICAALGLSPGVKSVAGLIVLSLAFGWGITSLLNAVPQDEAEK